MRFLLDTNIVSELRKPRPHGGVVAWSEAYPSDEFVIPAIALFEIQMGTEIVRGQDPERAQRFDAWIVRISSSGVVLPLDGQAARLAARLLKKHSLELMADAMIAAIALVHGLTVATRNVRDFERFDVPLVNPFEYRG